MQAIPSPVSPHPLPDFRAAEVRNKRVLLRVDFNDGMAENINSVGHRLQAALPTLQALLAAGARVGILTHRGRPQGRVVPALSTAPLALALAKLLQQKIEFVPDCIGRMAAQTMQKLAPGQVCMLENTRFHLGEQLNQATFAQQLALLGEVLVNDAFACAHRAQASTSGLAALLPSVFGQQFLQEMHWLASWQNAATPRTMLLGGNVVAPKLELMHSNLTHSQVILLAGVVGQTFLAAKDLHLHQSLIEFGAVEPARELLAEAGVLGCRIHLPRDFAVAEKSQLATLAATRKPHELQAGEVAQDLGPATLEIWQKVLHQAPSLVWFGSVGVWQQPAFREGTRTLANTVLARHRANPAAFTLLGGNGLLQALAAEDLLTPLQAAGVAISTGGGALQQALSGHPLPAVQAGMAHA